MTPAQGTNAAHGALTALGAGRQVRRSVRQLSGGIKRSVMVAKAHGSHPRC